MIEQPLPSGCGYFISQNILLTFTMSNVIMWLTHRTKHTKHTEIKENGYEEIGIEVDTKIWGFACC